MDEKGGMVIQADRTAYVACKDEYDDFFSSCSERSWSDEIADYASSISIQDADKIECVGNKEPISALVAEYGSGNPVMRSKIEKLANTYGAIRRTRGDGNCFFRSFMFKYLEHILETKNKAEVDRILKIVEHCKQALLRLGYAEFTFEDFLAVFVEQLDSVLPGKSPSISVDTLAEHCRDEFISNCVVMFFRFVTSCEIRQRADFYAPFIHGLTGLTVQQFCSISVEPMGEESDHIHITALTNALGVPTRVVYLDRSLDALSKVAAAEVTNHDFLPANSQSFSTAVNPPVILLYRSGHYDILYPK